MSEAMLQGEMNSHLGYSNNERGEKDSANRRNGYTKKTWKTTAGDVPIEVPRDRDGTFEPTIVPKRKRDVSDIQDKVLSMYAKGLSQRDIADTIEDIYGFEISHETISEITDSVLQQLEEWQNRPLKKFYTFLFVDCLYVTIRKDYETKNYAVYVILGYDVDGWKDILGLWLKTRFAVFTNSAFQVLSMLGFRLLSAAISPSSRSPWRTSRTILALNSGVYFRDMVIASFLLDSIVSCSR